MRYLPVNGELPHHVFFVQLDGTTYGFELRWNTRAQGWFLSVLDAQGNLLLAGRRLVIGWGLTGRFRLRDKRLPPGDVMAIDTSGQGKEAGLDDLGTRVVVTYVELAELQALGVSP